MSKESPEKTADNMENKYQRYLDLGGIINEKDYQNALDSMNNTHTLDRSEPGIRALIGQAKSIAKYAKIELSDSRDILDSRVELYVILRNDIQLNKAEYHKIQMDQHVFMEGLQMLGDVEAIDKMIKAYPKIFPFEHEMGK